MQNPLAIEHKNKDLLYLLNYKKHLLSQLQDDHQMLHWNKNWFSHKALATVFTWLDAAP